MRGSEGGIPYRQHRRPLTRHWAPTIGARPACGTTAWHYITTPNAADITCQDCKRAADIDTDPLPQ